MHSHQIVSIWKRYETGTDKPWAYMGPGRFALDSFVSYPVPNEFINDNPVWNCTKWNRTARNLCKHSLKVTRNTGIVDYIQGRLERMG